MHESIDPKTQITYMGSKIDGPSGPRPQFFIVGLSNFQSGIGHYIHGWHGKLIFILHPINGTVTNRAALN